MAFSAQLALLSFLRSVRSISVGRNLRAFILRCLLLWPRILRSSRKVWSWYFQTGFNYEKKMKGDTGWSSSTAMSRKREECAVVCASRDLGGGGESSRHAISASSDAEQSIPLEDVIQRTPSVPHSLSSAHSPSSQGSPRLLATLPSLGSRHSSASPLREMELFAHRSDTPSSWTHSRPSFPFRLRFSRPSIPGTHDIETRLAPIQHSQGSPEGSASEVLGPPLPASPEDKESAYSFFHDSRPRLSPVHDLTQSLPIRHQFQSTESMNLVSSHLRGQSPSPYGMHRGAQQSGGDSLNFTTLESIQAPPIPEPLVPPIFTPTSTVNPLNSPFELGTHSVRLMTSEEVSRYTKKGDV